MDGRGDCGGGRRRVPIRRGKHAVVQVRLEVVASRINRRVNGLEEGNGNCKFQGYELAIVSILHLIVPGGEEIVQSR